GIDWLQRAVVAGPWLFLVAVMMVSRVPTFSLKSVKIPKEYVLPVFIGLAALTGAVASYPWIVLSIIGVWYVLSIPVSVRTYQFLKREAEGMQRGEPPPSATAPQPQALPPMRHEFPDEVEPSRPREQG